MLVKKLSEGFEWENELHYYVGRNKRLCKSGQPYLGNPFVISGEMSREEVINRYRRYLWERMKKEEGLRKWLRELKAETVLFCHCKPLSCHGDVIVAASEWLKSVEG